jgi:phosphinothricin acetyltransferase
MAEIGIREPNGTLLADLGLDRVEEVELRPLRADDWPRVAEIYWDGIRDGLASFETDVPSWTAWDSAHLSEPRLVATVWDEAIGFVAAAPASPRRVYQGVAEHSIYIAREHRARGVGRLLLTAFVDATERAGIWTLQTNVFPENRASIALHLGCGFRQVGVRSRLAKRDGLWRDTCLLERRSEAVS